MRGKKISVICALLAMAVMLSGCSFTGFWKKNKLEFSNTDIAGQVTAIDGNTVTITLGYITEPADSSAASGTDTASGTDAAQTAAPSASPSPEVTAVAPTVDDGTGSSGDSQTSAQPEESQTPADSASSDEQTAGDADNQEAAKGVSLNKASFTLGSTTATLVIKDQTKLFKDDGVTLASLTDIKVESILSMEMDAKGVLTKIVIRDIPRIITSSGVNYIAANEYSKDTELSSDTIESTGTDENAAIVDNGAEVGFDGVTVNRTSSDSAGGTASVEYGVGAGILASDGKAFIRKSTVKTDANGGSGIFAYGSGKIYAADTSVDTAQADSLGLAASAGKLYGWDMTVSTKGESSAPLKSLEGGKLVVDGGTYASAGADAPAALSAAAMYVNGAALTAEASEAARVEGENQLYIFDSDVSTANSGDGACAVLIYSSASAPEEGTASFKMVGGSLKAAKGGLISATNISCNILLSGVEITAPEKCDYLLKCTGNAQSFGESGANGAVCSFTASKQEMSGDIVWDSISKLDVYLTDASKLTGAVKDDEDAVGEGRGEGYCDMYIGEDSTWVVTGDSTVTNLYCSGKIVDKDGNTVTVKNEDGKRLVRGDSEYVVTVSSYKDSADMSGALAVPQWSDYQVSKPTGM